MMIRIVAVFFAFIFANESMIAQEVKKEFEKSSTKMDLFNSRSGMIVKMTETKLPELKDPNRGAINGMTSIKKFSAAGIPDEYFFVIVKPIYNTYNNSVGFVDYDNLLEILKALPILKKEAEKDILLKPDLLENEFRSLDGMRIGYTIVSGKVNWYVRPDILSKIWADELEIETAFLNAKNKIDELRK